MPTRRQSVPGRVNNKGKGPMVGKFHVFRDLGKGFPDDGAESMRKRGAWTELIF